MEEVFDVNEILEEQIDAPEPTEERAKFVLKNKDYLLLFLGGLVSNIGTGIFNFAMSLYILKITNGNAIAAGVYMAFGAIVFFVFTPFGGAIVDRLNKVRVVYLADFVNGIAVLLAGFAIFSGIPTGMIIGVLYLASFILGVSGSVFNPAVRSLPAYMLEENQLQQASSLSQGMGAIYAILGPAIGGILYATIDIEFIFWINGLSFIFSGISEMFIRTNTSPDEIHTITFKSTIVDIKEGFKYIWGFKGIRNMLLIAALLNFFTVPVIVNGFPYLFTISLPGNEASYAIIMSVFPLGMIISTIILGVSKQKEVVSPMLVKGLYGMSVAFTIFGLATYLIIGSHVSYLVFMIIAVVSTLITGYFNAFVNVPFSVAILKSVDKNMLGRTMSVTSIISSGVTPLAIAIGGVAITYLGMVNLLILACVAMFVTSTMTWRNKAISEI